ncbi:MAG: lysostaphin resistance A-like protein, partial [Terriglobia bacterium]
RGLLQGRLSALYGRNGGILLQGIAFALAHGVTIGFPFHVFGGFYLGWLRARSRSLYPGMVVHLLYNATLVLSLAN